MIEIKDVVFRYGQSGFHLHLSQLNIRRGERVAILGASGVGKTTLLRLIAGVQVPTQGTVRVADIEVSSLDDASRRRFRAQRIGFVFQDFELIEYLTVSENILLPFMINRANKLDAKARAFAHELAQSTGLASMLGRRPGRLSHGERQRVAICRAVVTRPDILLADEPTGSLDRDTAVQILDLLFKHVEASRATLVFVTHDQSILDRFDRVVNLGTQTTSLVTAAEGI